MRKSPSSKAGKSARSKDFRRSRKPNRKQPPRETDAQQPTSPAIRAASGDRPRCAVCCDRRARRDALPCPRCGKPTREVSQLEITQAELDRWLATRCAAADDAPLPDEVERRGAEEQARLRSAVGAYCIVERVEQVGVIGDYLRYSVTVLASRTISKRWLQDALRGMERPLVDSESRDAA